MPGKLVLNSDVVQFMTNYIYVEICNYSFEYSALYEQYPLYFLFFSIIYIYWQMKTRPNAILASHHHYDNFWTP